MAQNEYEFSTRPATVSTKTVQAVLRHGDGVLGRPHRVARAPRRLFAPGQVANKYEFSTPSRRLESEVRKRSKLYCGTSMVYWDGRTAWPAYLGGYSP